MVVSITKTFSNHSWAMLSHSISVLLVKHCLPTTMILPCYNMSVETLDQILLFVGLGLCCDLVGTMVYTAHLLFLGVIEMLDQIPFFTGFCLH